MLSCLNTAWYGSIQSPNPMRVPKQACQSQNRPLRHITAQKFANTDMHASLQTHAPSIITQTESQSKAVIKQADW